jgi:hypothetical protein
MENRSIKSPFKAPDNYFEELEGRILSEVRISGLPAALPVPEGYFSDLENEIMAQVQMDQLNLAAPPSYFEEMEEQILAQVKLSKIPELSTPEKYFSDLESKLLAQVQLEGIKELPTPKGYFDQLENEVLNKIQKPKFGIFRNVFRYAAASVVLILTAYGVWNSRPHDEWADISSAEMVAYLSEQPLMAEDLTFVLDGNENLLTTEISDSEISDYLMDNGIIM